MTWDLNILTAQYLVNHLSISDAEAMILCLRYFKEYGLTLQGLVRHHQVDPLDFNQNVDAALPLDDLITPDLSLRKLLQDMDKSKIRLWLFTNGYVTHGKRVAELLGIYDLFEGIVSCDYTQNPIICKPHKEMYDLAESQAGVMPQDCYFVGE